MPLQKHFLHKEPKLPEISKAKLIGGILIGLGIAFAFYSALYVIREAFRIMSVTQTYDFWMLTSEENYFYNLFFACISVIIGQSFFFSFLIDRPKQFFGKFNYRKTTIINDQRALLMFFVSWFSRLALLFALIFGISFHGGFYAFSWYPDYRYLFILIVVVLFLQSWNSIRLTFKRKSLKWMLISMVILASLAYGLSRINVVDYETINKRYQSKNINYNYNLVLPTTDYYHHIHIRSFIKNIYVVTSKESTSNSKPIIIVDNEIVPLNKLCEALQDWQSLRDESELWFITYQLHIHKDVKMAFVNQLKVELSKADVSEIAYAVVPAHPIYDVRYYHDLAFGMRLPNWHSGWYTPKMIYREAYGSPNTIEITPNIAGNYSINNTIVESNELKRTIKLLIKGNSEYTILYSNNKELTFDQYSKVLFATREAIDELRDEFAMHKYKVPYEELYDDREDEIRAKYPFRIIELTDEFMDQLN